MGTVDHAKLEFQAAGWVTPEGTYEDEIQQAICEGILEILEKFANQGHSGFSANYAIAILTRLLKFQPITPLTGEDWEWTEMEDGSFQNKRCSSVFKDRDRFEGKPYHMDAVVFRDKDGGCYTNSESARVIEFPYTVPSEPTFVDRE